jgi:hypothetical protein
LLAEADPVARTMTMLGSLLLLGLAVVVEGDTTCPDPAQVASHLQPLLADVPAGIPPDRAQLIEAGGTIEITLRTASGRLVATRHLAVQPGCDELAAAIAVMIAAWEGELAGGTAAISLDAPPPAERPVTRTPLVYELGASLVAAWSGTEATGGGSVELWLGPGASAWAGHLSLLGLSSEQQALPPGTVSWTRPRAAIGGRYRLARDQRVSLDLRADALAAALFLRGGGFSANETAVSFDPGLSAGARLDVSWGRWTGFLEASAVGWLRDQRAAVTGLAQAVDLPRAEALLQLGVTARLGTPEK